MRIGIFGGSFNPPHNVHRDIAISLIENNYVDKVIFVPTGSHYNKKNLINEKHRYEMVKLMIKGYGNLDVSDYELCSNLIYTYQTLRYFSTLYKNDEIYFICGADNIKEITTWKNYNEILNNYKILVIGRNDINLWKIKQLSNNIIDTNIVLNNLSSTFIRNNINSSNKYLDYKVYKYIRDNNLYIL